MKGDWGKGAKLHPTIINITVDAEEQVNHVGIGYEIEMPSGKVHGSGYTHEFNKKKVQSIVDEILLAAREHEGL